LQPQTLIALGRLTPKTPGDSDGRFARSSTIIHLGIDIAVAFKVSLAESSLMEAVVELTEPSAKTKLDVPIRRLVKGAAMLLALAFFFTGPACAPPKSKPVASAKAHFEWGRKLLEGNDYNRAIQEFNSAIALAPKYMAAYELRGQGYLVKGDYDSAIADFSEAIRLGSKDAGTYSKRGVAFARKGDYDSAIADFGKALKRGPRDSRTIFNRGSAYLKKQDFDRAIADFTESIALAPKDFKAQALAGRGSAHAAKKDYAAAIADYTAAIELEPGNASFYTGRGRAHRAKGDEAKAVADLEKARQLGQRR